MTEDGIGPAQGRSPEQVRGDGVNSLLIAGILFVIVLAIAAAAFF